MSHCPACGNPFGPGDQFCAGCGAPLPEPPVPSPAAHTGGRIPWYRTAQGVIGIAMVAVAAAVVAVVLIIAGGDDDGTASGGTVPPTLPPVTTLAPTSTTTSTTVPATTTTQAPASGFEASQVAAFMDECLETGLFTEEECSCWLDGLRASGVGGEDLDLILTSEEALPEDLESTLNEALAGCWEFGGTTTGGTEYSKDFRDLFMSNCRSGGNRSFCRCALEEFQEAYTEQELGDILEGTVPVPAGFSDVSLTCLPELPLGAPLPAFALPFSCPLDEWQTVVRYPSGWSVYEDGGCMYYRPGDWSEGFENLDAPILVIFDDVSTIEAYIADFGQPEVIDLGDRPLYVFSLETEPGFEVRLFAMPAWAGVEGAPLVTVSAAGFVGSPDHEAAVLAAEAMIRGIQIAPYTP